MIHPLPTRSPIPLWSAVIAFAVSVTLTAIGTFSGERDDTQVDLYWINVLAAAVASVAVGVVVHKTLAAGDEDVASRRAQLLGAGSLVFLAVFWTGIPQVLAVGAAVLGAQALARGTTTSTRRRATTAITLAVVSGVILLLLALQEIAS
jgi:hypothetical protein